MHVSGSDHLAAALKAQGAAMVALTSVAFECIYKVTEANLQAGKAAIAAQQQNVAAVLAADDSRKVLATQSNLTQPATEKALAYSRQIQEIVAATQVEFHKIITADHEQNSRRAQDYVAHVIKHLPACVDATTALWQSAFAAANGTYEAAKHASELVQANIAAANLSRAPA
ncbi:TIGR01841 family phasin [Cupriavidus necator]|uniref:TIGR01841 family phasin n=1 Tax=Cupriavidus necator TaxID=106590 RepID=UPI0005B2F728|nr:TIGR01841 family phasin [Cupriavidus necator]